MAQPASKEVPVEPVTTGPPPLTPPAELDQTQMIPTGHGFSSVLKNRSFLVIWSAQIASQVAQNSIWFVLIILIAKITGGSALGIGGIIIMVQLPTVLFSSVSGVLVDRVSKKAVLIATNAIRAVAVVGYLVFSGYGEALYLITFFVSVVSQPFQPAEGATIPLLVTDDQLITANSLFQATFMGSQIVGFAMAPILLQFAGQTITFFVLIGMFAYAAAILVLLPPITTRRTVVQSTGMIDSAEKIWLELLEGLRAILADRKLLMAIIQITFAPTLLLLVAQVAPGFAREVLHTAYTAMFWVLAPAGLGMGIGLFILGHWGARLRKDRLVVVALLALSITILGLADVPSLAHEFWLPFSVIGINPAPNVERLLTMIPISLLLGIEIAFINAPIQTIVQERAPERLRGRILAMQQTLTAAVAIIPLLLIGGIAAAVGVQGALSLIGVVLFVVALASVYEI